MNEGPEGLFTQIVLEIFKVSGMLNIEGDVLTEEFGLSSARWKVMGAIARSKDPLTVSQIGREMGQSRQATQRVVDSLKRDCLLKLVENPNHKKARYVDLTEDGIRIFCKLVEKQKPWILEGAKKVTHHELSTTLSTLRKISDYLGAN